MVHQKRKTSQSGGAAPTRRLRRAFTLVDVLVSLAVVAILLTLLSPVISEARHAAWRVVCANNVRQAGIGIALYAEDYRELLPPSVFVTKEEKNAGANGFGGVTRYFTDTSPTETTTLRLGPVFTMNKKGYSKEGWDGIGLLYGNDYIPVSGSYYCPAHNADQQYENYETAWRRPHGVIRGNYQYRGEGPNKERRLNMVEPRTTALLSDSLRQIDEWSHQSGVNVMTADLAIRWVIDDEEQIRSSIPVSLTASSQLPAQFDPRQFRFPIDQTWSIADLVISRTR